MATKYRRDLTEEDFRLLKRFKHHMHRLALAEQITLYSHTAKTVYEQSWYLSGLGWIDNGQKERNAYPCYFLSMRDFRAIVRAIARDIETVTEGFVLETLKRFSMILYKKDGKWKWQDKTGMPVIVLEFERLSRKVLLSKRNHETPKARLEAYDEKINETMNELGIDYQTALLEVSVGGITEVVLTNLRRQIAETTAKKEEHRTEIDKRIRQRQNKR